MRKIYLYMLTCLMAAASCVKSIDEPCELPVSGKWANLNEDGSVKVYVMFNNGRFSEYAATAPLYYYDEKIWHVTDEDFNKTFDAWYSIRDGVLSSGNITDKIDISEGVLKLGDFTYLPVESLEAGYGFNLTHNVPLNAQGVVECSSDTQYLLWTYGIENLPEGYRLSVSEDAAWIKSVQVEENQVMLTLEKNQTMIPRTAAVTFSHPAVADLQFTLQQNVSGPRLSSASTSVTYAAGSYEIDYTIENPREGVTLEADWLGTWITDVSLGNNKLKFNVLENNSGSSRTADIVLTYGDVVVNHQVTQSYSAPSITCNPTSTSCDYASASKSFTYTLNNPREGQSVKVTCSESWITNLVHEGTKVSFKVADNISGSSRSGNIVLTYGAVTVNHKVEQMTKLVDLSSSETANCYIVSESGAYKFKTVKGNSTTSVGTVSSAVVLWETFGTSTTPNVGDLIKSVSYKDSYITFQTADTFKEGNAVIAAKDASGTILWSWHIWLTDQPQGQEYYNNAGTMMDRNLGATSATPGDVGALGLLYQWGRKDPFLGSSSISSSTQVKSTITWPSAVSSNSSNGTIAYATANPTTFIEYNSSNYDWYYTGSSSTDNTRWTTSESNKSIYDPCPAGWRVPDGGSTGVWSKAKGSSSRFSHTYNSLSEGMNFSGKFGSASTIWYPASGCRVYYDGSLFDVGYYGYYWSASPTSGKAYGLLFYDDGYVYPSDDLYRAFGQSVRCLQVID